MSKSYFSTCYNPFNTAFIYIHPLKLCPLRILEICGNTINKYCHREWEFLLLVSVCETESSFVIIYDFLKKVKH